MAIFGLASGDVLIVFIAVSLFMTCFSLYQQLKYAGPGEFDDPDEVDYSASIYAKRPQAAAQEEELVRPPKAASLEDERAEQQKIDAILAKVSAHGMNSLTWLEKRPSARPPSGSGSATWNSRGKIEPM